MATCEQGVNFSFTCSPEIAAWCMLCAHSILHMSEECFHWCLGGCCLSPVLAVSAHSQLSLLLQPSAMESYRKGGVSLKWMNRFTIETIYDTVRCAQDMLLAQIHNIQFKKFSIQLIPHYCSCIYLAADKVDMGLQNAYTLYNSISSTAGIVSRSAWSFQSRIWKKSL